MKPVFIKQRVFLESFKGQVKFDEPLKGHTSLQIGGRARYWIEPGDIDDLIKVFRFSKDEGLNTFIIGEGTNLLVRDTGFKGIVVNLSAPYFKRIYRGLGDAELVFAGAGVKLETLRTQAQEWSLKGFEFLSGIPGSVGGGLVMNAGVKDSEGNWLEIGELVREVWVLDSSRKVRAIKREDLNFNYRSSNLNEYIILGAVFKSESDKREEILKKTESFLKRRARTQELRFPSAGCIFKNPSQGRTAGWLLERCGLKGFRIGDAQFSDIHANFIVNLGRASFSDATTLIEVAKKKVKEEFDVELELEIKVL